MLIVLIVAVAKITTVAESLLQRSSIRTEDETIQNEAIHSDTNEEHALKASLTSLAANLKRLL